MTTTKNSILAAAKAALAAEHARGEAQKEREIAEAIERVRLDAFTVFDSYPEEIIRPRIFPQDPRGYVVLYDDTYFVLDSHTDGMPVFKFAIPSPKEEGEWIHGERVFRLSDVARHWGDYERLFLSVHRIGRG